MSKFERFFSTNKVMITAFVITLIAFALQIVCTGIRIIDDPQNIYFAANAVIMFFIALSMYRSFAKHETNAMHILTGAAIGILLMDSIRTCVSNIIVSTSLLSIIIPVINVVLFVVLLANHVLINSIHRSTRGRIILNQVILIIIAVYQILVIIATIVLWAFSPESMLLWIGAIAASLSRLFICNMIICIETKLNAYKIDRGAAMAEGTWTEEKKAETKEKYFGK